MCGIVGLTGPGAGAAVALMRDALAHRGPDGAGLFEDATLALGHRRLAIIDLSDAASQPFTNEAGTLVLVFNGEIYNYVELRDELRAKGRAFKTASDTEVILRGYEAWGERVLERLNGMFAIALYDVAKKSLLLARDRAGEKPLHYGWLEGQDGKKRFAFASELAALFACPLTLSPRPSPLGIARYLAYEYVPAPDSALEGLAKLAGGEALVLSLETGATRTFRYWTPSFEEKLVLSLDETKERLRTALEASVRIRLRSDVPLGVFLSGGVDSSTIAAIARKLLPGKELRTYSIGFEDATFDEAGYARTVARHLETRHVEETISEKVLLETLPQVLAHQDEPLADGSILPTFLVSRLARREVTVALGGDGGDELFCGYDPFKAWAAARLYGALVPRALNDGVFLPLARLLPSSTKKMGLDFKVKRFLGGALAPLAWRLQSFLGAFAPGEIRTLLAPEIVASLGDALAPENLYAPTTRAWDAAGNVSEVDRQSSVYFHTYLQDGVLQKVDRASMQNALETRAPFLDPELMALAFRLPAALKYHHLETKRVLKALARELVPPEVIDRKKQGFSVPLARWLRGPLLSLLEATLAPERVKAGGLLRPEAVALLLAANRAGRADPRQLWTLFVLETWRSRWVVRL
jgi:asparagine synthase (glutamine-hydrolysing)